MKKGRWAYGKGSWASWGLSSSRVLLLYASPWVHLKHRHWVVDRQGSLGATSSWAGGSKLASYLWGVLHDWGLLLGPVSPVHYPLEQYLPRSLYCTQPPKGVLCVVQRITCYHWLQSKSLLFALLILPLLWGLTSRPFIWLPCHISQQNAWLTWPVGFAKRHLAAPRSSLSTSPRSKCHRLVALDAQRRDNCANFSLHCCQFPPSLHIGFP